MDKDRDDLETFVGSDLPGSRDHFFTLMEFGSSINILKKEMVKLQSDLDSHEKRREGESREIPTPQHDEVRELEEAQAQEEEQRRRAEALRVEQERVKERAPQEGALKGRPKVAQIDASTGSARTSAILDEIVAKHKVDKESTVAIADEFHKMQEAGALREVPDYETIPGQPPKYEVYMKVPDVPAKGESKVFHQRFDENGPVLVEGKPVIDILIYKDGEISGGHFPDAPGEPNFGPKTMAKAEAANKARGIGVEAEQVRAQPSHTTTKEERAEQGMPANADVRNATDEAARGRQGQSQEFHDRENRAPGEPDVRNAVEKKPKSLPKKKEKRTALGELQQSGDLEAGSTSKKKKGKAALHGHVDEMREKLEKTKTHTHAQAQTSSYRKLKERQPSADFD